MLKAAPFSCAVLLSAQRLCVKALYVKGLYGRSVRCCRGYRPGDLYAYPVASDRGEAEAKIKAAESAYAEAAQAIRDIEALQERIEVAGQFSSELRAQFEEVARIRHEAALEIYDAEKLSLAQLADRVGISKARADQIVRAREKAQQEKEKPDG